LSASSKASKRSLTHFSRPRTSKRDKRGEERTATLLTAAETSSHAIDKEGEGGNKDKTHISMDMMQ